jgi:hypothetical protein
LAEIGRYYGSIDEFVIAGGPVLSGFQSQAEVNKVLPWLVGGAIILKQQGGAA